MLHKPAETVPHDQLLIERAYHYCRLSNFTKNLALMFTAKSDKLLTSKYLEIDKKLHQLEANKKMLKFCK